MQVSLGLIDPFQGKVQLLFKDIIKNFANFFN